MSYEYSDRAGDKLDINYCYGKVAVIARTSAGRKRQAIAVQVRAEDAPAVARAILEEAGYGATDAARSLAALSEQVEGERGDAAVRAWLRRSRQDHSIPETYDPSEMERQDYAATRAVTRFQ